MLQYMQTFRNCVGTAQSVLALSDIDTIFYGIPELHMAHKFFVRELEPRVSNWSADQQIGEMFRTLVSSYVLPCFLTALLLYFVLCRWLSHIIHNAAVVFVDF